MRSEDSILFAPRRVTVPTPPAEHVAVAVAKQVKWLVMRKSIAYYPVVGEASDRGFGPATRDRSDCLI